MKKLTASAIFCAIIALTMAAEPRDGAEESLAPVVADVYPSLSLFLPERSSHQKGVLPSHYRQPGVSSLHGFLHYTLPSTTVFNFVTLVPPPPLQQARDHTPATVTLYNIGK